VKSFLVRVFTIEKAKRRARRYIYQGNYEKQEISKTRNNNYEIIISIMIDVFGFMRV
jgi:hypothetical protein